MSHGHDMARIRGLTVASLRKLKKDARKQAEDEADEEFGDDPKRKAVKSAYVSRQSTRYYVKYLEVHVRQLEAQRDDISRSNRDIDNENSSLKCWLRDNDNSPAVAHHPNHPNIDMGSAGTAVKAVKEAPVSLLSSSQNQRTTQEHFTTVLDQVIADAADNTSNSPQLVPGADVELLPSASSSMTHSPLPLPQQPVMDPIIIPPSILAPYLPASSSLIAPTINTNFIPPPTSHAPSFSYFSPAALPINITTPTPDTTQPMPSASLPLTSFTPTVPTYPSPAPSPPHAMDTPPLILDPQHSSSSSSSATLYNFNDFR